MTGPGWLAAGFAGLMLLIAAACAGRLAIWQLRGRDTEPEADGLHVLMGVAMAGMLEPRLIPVPTVAWRAVFAGAAAWFAWQAIRARSREISSRAALAAAMSSMSTARPGESQVGPVISAPAACWGAGLRSLSLVRNQEGGHDAR